MGQNIKKKTAHNIYYGLDRKTGVLRHISDVPSGAKCACDCIACGKPLEARKGSVRKHHFAHESNYECLYAAEVAVYKATADVITELGRLALPAISISFPAWRKDELLKDAQIIEPDQVLFECSPLQYPPMLTIRLQRSKLRLLFEFGAYYSEEDLCNLIHEAESENYSLLLYHFLLSARTPSLLQAALKQYFKIHMRKANGFEAPLWISVGHGICPWPLSLIYGAEDMNAQYTKENTEENIRQDGLIAHIASSIWQLRQDVYAWPQESPGFHPTFKSESQTEEQKTTLALCPRHSRWPSGSH